MRESKREQERASEREKERESMREHEIVNRDCLTSQKILKLPVQQTEAKLFY